MPKSQLDPLEHLRDLLGMLSDQAIKSYSATDGCEEQPPNTCALHGYRINLLYFFMRGSDGFVIANEDGTKWLCNAAWERILGRSADEVGLLGFGLLHPDDLEDMSEALRQLGMGFLVLDHVNRFKHKNGEWVELNWSIVRDGDLLLASVRPTSSSPMPPKVQTIT